MAKETSLLPKMEVLIIIIFFIGFVIWAFDKCGDTKRSYSEQVNAESDAVDELINRNISGVELPPPDSSTITTEQLQQPIAPNRTVVPKQGTTLYITIDGMNLRDKPTLGGKILTRLELYEEVTFLNEVTDSTQQIKLGSITTNEPWVKVQGRGHVGWVYGAGVEYYKMKLDGME